MCFVWEFQVGIHKTDVDVLITLMVDRLIKTFLIMLLCLFCCSQLHLIRFIRS